MIDIAPEKTARKDRRERKLASNVEERGRRVSRRQAKRQQRANREAIESLPLPIMT